MKFSGRTQMLSDRYSVFEALDILKDAGFDGVELCFEDMNFRLRPDLWDPGVAALIRGRCEKLGLAVSAVGNHISFLFDDFMFEAVKKCIRATRLYGTDILIISALHSQQEREAHPDIWQTAVSRVGELCKVAESEGVRLALEPEPPSIVTSTVDFLFLRDEVGSPALGINLDVGHAFLTDPDLIESVGLLRGSILHGHIEDMRRERHQHLMPGDGEIDFRALFAKLKEAGFGGYMSVDLYHARYEDIAGQALAALRSFRDGA